MKIKQLALATGIALATIGMGASAQAATFSLLIDSTPPNPNAEDLCSSANICNQLTGTVAANINIDANTTSAPSIQYRHNNTGVTQNKFVINITSPGFEFVIPPTSPKTLFQNQSLTNNGQTLTLTGTGVVPGTYYSVTRVFNYAPGELPRDFTASASATFVRVPESSSPLTDTLAFGILGSGFILKRKLKQQVVKQ